MGRAGPARWRRSSTSGIRRVAGHGRAHRIEFDVAVAPPFFDDSGRPIRTRQVVSVERKPQ